MAVVVVRLQSKISAAPYLAEMTTAKPDEGPTLSAVETRGHDCQITMLKESDLALVA